MPLSSQRPESSIMPNQQERLPDKYPKEDVTVKLLEIDTDIHRGGEQNPSADDLRTKMPVTIDDRKAAGGMNVLGARAEN